MNNNKTGRRILIVTIVCAIYLLLSIFYYQIDKYLTGIVFIILTLLLPTTFIAMITYAIKGLFEIYHNRKILTFRFCLPTIIVLFTLLYTLFSPWRLDSENWESKVEMRACYEGTQNQSYIKFREDHTFEIHSTGVFFASFWYWGQWEKNSDTLFLKFDTEKNKLLSDTIIIHDEYLIPIGQFELADSTKMYNRYYYLGYCKGLN
jgi:hypothetical protein